MFTDTKNSAFDVATSGSVYSTKRRTGLKKALRPFWRLLSKKGPSHPNNMNLNNIASAKDDVCPAVESLEYASVLRKVGEDSQLLPADAGERGDEAVASSPIIRSASYEKPPTTFCSGCCHGLNCQHAQLHAVWSRAEGFQDADLLSLLLICRNFGQHLTEASTTL